MAEVEVCEAIRKRYQILDALRDEKLAKSDLESNLDISRSTVNRGINELQEYDLVERDRGAQVITLYGKLALSIYDKYYRLFEKVYDTKALLKELPKDLNIDGELIRDSTISIAEPPAPRKPLDEITERVSESDTVELLSPVIVSNHVSVYVDFSSIDGSSLSIVCTKDVIKYAIKHHFEETKQFIRDDSTIVGVLERNLNYGVVICDSEVMWINVFGARGELLGSIKNESSLAVEWAEEKFDGFLSQASPVTNISELEEYR
jgi:predicted transcriptional regulator